MDSIAPEAWVGEDDLDWRENQTRSGGDRWRVDIALIGLSLLGVGLLIAIFVMGRHGFHR